MLARKACSEEKQKVIEFYEKVCHELLGAEYTPYWEVGVYPTYEELDTFVEEGRVYIGFEGKDILCAAVISQGEDPIYAGHNWNHKASDDKVGIIHLLAVDSSHKGKGYAGEFVIFLLGVLADMGLEVCHLDALADNVPAIKLYNRFGFETSGKTIIHYDDLGDVYVYLFEYDLKKISSYC